MGCWPEPSQREPGSRTFATVPTPAEINSGYTDFSDLSIPRAHLLGPICWETFQNGQIFDPATTRSVTAGRSTRHGLAATATGYVRDLSRTTSFRRIGSIKCGEADATLSNADFAGVLYNYNTIKVDSINTNTADVRIDQHFRDQDRRSSITTTSAVFVFCRRPLRVSPTGADTEMELRSITCGVRPGLHAHFFSHSYQ